MNKGKITIMYNNKVKEDFNGQFWEIKDNLLIIYYEKSRRIIPLYSVMKIIHFEK